MVAKKQTSGSTKSTSTSKSTKSRASSSKAAAQTGPLPPYGIAIKEAVARGDMAGMQNVAASARKWMKEVQTALDKLEKAIEKKGRK